MTGRSEAPRGRTGERVRCWVGEDSWALAGEVTGIRALRLGQRADVPRATLGRPGASLGRRPAAGDEWETAAGCGRVAQAVRARP